MDQLNRENLLFFTGCPRLLPCPILERRNHAHFLIGTVHVENGLANVSALNAILDRIRQ